MIVFILKSVVRLLGLIGLIIIVPVAAFNPVIENQWLIWMIGAVLALNIIFNEPMPPNQAVEPTEPPPQPAQD